MERKTITIGDTCKKCMTCVGVCPNRIMVKNDAGEIIALPDRVCRCIKCGQCMAACPTKSILVEGLSYENDLFNISLHTDSDNVFNSIIQSRRSVRNFKDKPVPADLLEKIVEAISFAPPAFPPIKYSLLVVRDRELISSAFPEMLALYEKMVMMMKKPVMRYFIRKKIGRPRFRLLESHLMPKLEADIPLMKVSDEDTLMRHAPSIILFLADKDSEDVTADIYIAVTIGTLAAHSYGLGSTITDIIPPAIQRSPTLRKMFRIPDDKDVVASLIIGFPKYKYLRGVRRKIKSVEWM